MFWLILAHVKLKKYVCHILSFINALLDMDLLLKTESMMG